MRGPFLKRIRIRNFKSFADVDLELGRFNVIVGANAAGKSNAVQVFRFLRDIRWNGLDNAISMQGGSQYIHNLRLGDKSTSIELETALPKGVRIPIPTKSRVYSTGGRWILEFRIKGQSIEVVKDSWTFYVSDRDERGLDDFMGSDGKRSDSQKNGPREGTVRVTRNGGGLCFDVDFDNDLKDALDNYTAKSYAGKNELLAESELLERLFPRVFCFEEIGTYDFDSKRAGGSARANAAPALEEDGSNLAATLKNILAGDSGGSLRALVSDLLPSVEYASIEDFAETAAPALDGESLRGDRPPAAPLSDGTVNAVALIVSLYFGDRQVVVIKEPEKRMHPSLMARTVGMMKDASGRSQIIVTTHSPELVSHAGLESLHSVRRGAGGFSEIGRPSASREIRQFLENDMGAGEMHVQNMLDW